MMSIQSLDSQRRRFVFRASSDEFETSRCEISNHLKLIIYLISLLHLSAFSHFPIKFNAGVSLIWVLWMYIMISYNDFLFALL